MAKKSLFKEMAETKVSHAQMPDIPEEFRVRKAENGYIVTYSGGKHGYSSKDVIAKDKDEVMACFEEHMSGKKKE